MPEAIHIPHNQSPVAISAHPDFLRTHHIWTLDQLEERAKVLKAADYVISGLVPQQAITMIVGDSGLGKSPLLYQAAICVAAGVPFLGRRVQQSRVLYIDHENGLAQIGALANRLATFLRLPETPADFRIWSANDSTGPFDLAAVCREFKPNWVIIDPLSMMYPAAERDNSSAAEVFTLLRQLMSEHHCSLSIMHHLRKPKDDPKAKREPLENAEWNTWFHQARGPSVFINNSDVRLGVDRPALCLSKDHLIVKGFERVNGDIPIIRVCRVRGQDGDPVGYKLLGGADQLENPEQRAAYHTLPQAFAFGQAKAVYSRGDQATTDFLNKCITANILYKAKRGWYEKINPGDEDQTVQ
jgi:AAA domain-containing protein